MKFIAQLLLWVALWGVADAAGQGAPGGVQPDPTLIAGQVYQVSKAGGKVNIVHEPIAALALGAGTTEFRVTDHSSLDRLKPGMRLFFKAERVDGLYVMTEYRIRK